MQLIFYQGELKLGNKRYPITAKVLGKKGGRKKEERLDVLGFT